MDLESPSTPLFCYDTFCDWIGGLDLVHPHAPFLEADRPNEFSSDLAQKQFFFSGPLLILEVLWLKISLFQLLSEQVFTFYQEKKKASFKYSSRLCSGFIPAIPFLADAMALFIKIVGIDWGNPIFL